jgi:anti-sigma-K factor RskA
MSGLLWIIGLTLAVVVVVAVVLAVCFTYPRRNQEPIPYAIITVSMKYTVSKVLS